MPPEGAFSCGKVIGHSPIGGVPPRTAKMEGGLGPSWGGRGARGVPNWRIIKYRPGCTPGPGPQGGPPGGRPPRDRLAPDGRGSRIQELPRGHPYIGGGLGEREACSACMANRMASMDRWIDGDAMHR